MVCDDKRTVGGSRTLGVFAHVGQAPRFAARKGAPLVLQTGRHVAFARPGPALASSADVRACAIDVAVRPHARLEKA